MKRSIFFTIGISLLSVGLALPVGQASAQILFDFNNLTEFDGAGVGATMTATDGVNSVVITTVDIIAPEYDESSVLTGVILSALNGDSVVTNIGSPNALGVNNLTINNAGYDLLGGAGTESNDFNPGESWVMEFDVDVIITELNFASLGTGDESIDVTIEGGATTNFVDAPDDGDDYVNPFGTTVITAGTNITFTGVGSLADAGARVAEITVQIPGTGVLLGDVDLDGEVTFLDIQPFIAVLSGNGFQLEADCDESGVVDFLDISVFIAILAGP